MARLKLHRLLLLTFGVMGVTMLLFGLQVSRLPDSKSHGDNRSNEAISRDDLERIKKGIDNAPGRLGGRDTSVVTQKKIAYAITVTKDGPYLDGAAVLKQSILNTKPQVPFDFVAILHPGVTETRAGLIALGFKIKEFEAPITAKEIRGEKLRNEIDQTGCCGSMELLKLRAYQLHEYRRVLLLDLDTMLVKNLDHLFTDPKMEKSLLFTYDHAMDGGGRAPPVQGGFLLLTPSETKFEEMVEVVREGDFRSGTGWAGSRIGWAWGGQTIQGLVSYYYNMLAKPDESFELNHCEYNSMATTKDCRYMDFDKVMSVHFTWCQKPWECHKGMKPICEHFHTHWWNMRKEFEISEGLEPGPRCCNDKVICPSRHYQKIKLELLPGHPNN